jgi:hypothetical protein
VVSRLGFDLAFHSNSRISLTGAQDPKPVYSFRQPRPLETSAAPPPPNILSVNRASISYGATGSNDPPPPYVRTPAADNKLTYGQLDSIFGGLALQDPSKTTPSAQVGSSSGFGLAGPAKSQQAVPNYIERAGMSLMFGGLGADSKAAPQASHVQTFGAGAAVNDPQKQAPATNDLVPPPSAAANQYVPNQASPATRTPCSAGLGLSQPIEPLSHEQHHVTRISQTPSLSSQPGSHAAAYVRPPLLSQPTSSGNTEFMPHLARTPTAATITAESHNILGGYHGINYSSQAAPFAMGVQSPPLGSPGLGGSSTMALPSSGAVSSQSHGVYSQPSQYVQQTQTQAHEQFHLHHAGYLPHEVSPSSSSAAIASPSGIPEMGHRPSILGLYQSSQPAESLTGAPRFRAAMSQVSPNPQFTEPSMAAPQQITNIPAQLIYQPEANTQLKASAGRLGGPVPSSTGGLMNEATSIIDIPVSTLHQSWQQPHLPDQTQALLLTAPMHSQQQQSVPTHEINHLQFPPSNTTTSAVAGMSMISTENPGAGLHTTGGGFPQYPHVVLAGDHNLDSGISQQQSWTANGVPAHSNWGTHLHWQGSSGIPHNQQLILPNTFGQPAVSGLGPRYVQAVNSIPQELSSVRFEPDPCELE